MSHGPGLPSEFGDGVLTPFADSVWTAATPIRFVGMWTPHVMSVIRSRDGRLILHSPCHPSAQLIEQIAALGPVAHIIAPNWFHDLYLAEYRRLYPESTFWGPTVLRRQLGPTLIDQELTETTRPPWFDEMPHVTLSGLLTFDESMFFHGPSGTLILADLLMNHSAGPDAPMFTRFMYWFGGLNDRLVTPTYLRWFGWLSNRAIQSVSKAAQQIETWNPDRLIVGHGRSIKDQAMPQLRLALKR